jgi:hypothetical protein
MLRHRQIHDLLDEPALADPRLAEQHHDPTASFLRRRQLSAELSQLHVPAGEERRAPLARPPCGLDTHRLAPLGPASRRGGRRLAQDLPVEALGLGVGLHAELAAQYLGAGLIVPERRPALTPPGVQTHQRAVDRLLEGIEGEETEGDLDRRVGRPGGGVPTSQTSTCSSRSCPRSTRDRR